MSRKLEIRIGLNTLNHLGINLYSTVPAVLSEIVANAWDADATQVDVVLSRDTEKIVIQDNGAGMTRDEVIEHYLTIGFRRRIVLGPTTARFERRPMGRKGIGNLSSFSIAQVVKVYTTKDGEQTAFRMDVDKIRECIERNVSTPYYPDELQSWPANMDTGTRIELSGLRRQMTKLTQKGLRQRLARRFSVIGARYNFKITVDGKEVGPDDRGYYRYIEYLWTYGDQSDEIHLFKNLVGDRTPVERGSEIAHSTNEAGIQIMGWIGTVKHPRHLKDAEGKNLNSVAIFMRGKLAQEDILGDFGQKELYADYLVGEIHCDDLDSDDHDDIATSSRQALKYDDPRFTALRNTVLRELRHIASLWSHWRREDGTKKFIRDIPAVENWISSLHGDTKKKAQKWIGRLNVIRSDKDEEDKKELLKASILAFESYRRKEQLSLLENLTDQSIGPVLQIFKDIDDLELSYYGQIAKLRLGVITTLTEKLSNDDKEKVIRDYLYSHLWLLDPSWERARGSEVAERTLNTFLENQLIELSPEQKKGRIDIGYRTVVGRHVIIELKRASVSTPVDELTRQIRKYRDGARTLLEQSDFPDWPLDIVCLVGTPPPEWSKPGGPKDVQRSLASVDARLVFYDALLGNSQRAYAEYLEKHREIDQLWKIFEGIDDFTASGE